MGSAKEMALGMLKPDKVGMTGIAFMGGMGCGKTTQARRVSKEYGFTPTSIALGIKTLAQQYFGITSKLDSRARKTYQKIGQSFRNIDPNVWINDVMDRVNHSPNGTVIDDVRYPNEPQALADAGFLLVYLRVPLLERVRRLCKRDFSSRSGMALGIKILLSMLHPSELLIPLALRRAKRSGRLIVIDGSRPEEDVSLTIAEHMASLQ
jgi:hypothetical protein